MSVSRRAILQTAAVGATAMAVAGCEDGLSALTRRLGQSVPASVVPPEAEGIDSAHHLLSRAGYGPWPGDVQRVREMGEAAWVEQQLDPDSIDDRACDLRARRFETIVSQPGTCFEYKKEVLREEMSRHTLLRAVYSKRQLFEAMVAFWTDHLNVNIEKGDCIYLKPFDDRTVVRRHALGRFRDLVRASATSPAMLVYLDGKENARAKPADVPNENYARELLELHTLGVDGGYTQQDVYEVARCLTGWRVRSGFRRGTVYLDPALHDDGEKRVLGQTIRAGLGGEQDLERVIDIACAHPSTARFVCRKLVQRFVSEEPPVALVNRLVGVFCSNDGQIKPVLRALLSSDEFRAARGTKFKTPFRFVASALRAVAADTHAHAPLIEYLTRMGQGIFQYPTPDGYPDEAAPWMGTLLWRWNFAFALAADKVPTVEAPVSELCAALGAAKDEPAAAETLHRHFAGGAPNSAQRAALASAVAALRAGAAAAPEDNQSPPSGSCHQAQLVGLLLASPSFQRY